MAKPPIQSGVGFHNTIRDFGMVEDSTMQFLESWCVNPELFQDIKNEILKRYNYYVGGSGKYFARKHFLVTQARVNDAHRVLVIIVIAHRVPSGPGTYFHHRKCGELYFSITKDGLITDILKARPNMNEGNNRPVAHYTY